MKLLLLATLSMVFFVQHARGQCTSCSATNFSFDLSASTDTSVSVESVRNGNCCTGTNCIRFNITMNPACSYVNLTVINPAPSGSAYYQVNCGPQTSIGVPICIVGMTNVCITYCKPGNDAATYIITAAGALQGSPDITVREGCTGTMGVKGLLLPTINWKSIYPGAQGIYNSFLNCTTQCDTVTVSPQQGSPSYIDYQVSGNRLCGITIYDTIRVYTQPKMTVAISPLNPDICPDGSSTIALTATPANGDAPYNFLWNNGATTASTNVNATGTYSVTVSDNNSNCSAVTQQVTVNPLANPPTPTVTSNSPLCAGSNLNLFASAIPGASYSWTGPNGFTSNQQNPVINNATANNSGTYTVSVTINGCTRSSNSTAVVINPIPSSPLVSGNAPLCEGSDLNLFASNIANATYSWTGPNGFTSNQQNPVINIVNSTNAGIYTVTATVNGCTSNAATTSVIVNALPAIPVVNSNSPLCSGNDLLLTASSNAGATYSWTGPSGFNSTLQNSTISNVNATAAGNYFVTALLNGCASSPASIAVIINQTPGSPVTGSNGPVCEGSTLNLTASLVANATYSWTGPNGFSSSVQNPVINNTTMAGNGIYMVVVTANGCQSNPANIAATIKPIPVSPVVSGNSPLCQGNNLSLVAGNIAGASYAWSGPGGFSSSLQNPSIANVNVNHSGIYSLIATVNGCASNASAMPVTINPIPSPPLLSANSPVCTGNLISLSAGTIANATYYWTGPNGFTSSLQNPSISNVTSANAGSYNAIVTVNGCNSGNASTIVNINPTPPSPVATNNGALCEGSNLNLLASSIAGATYHWTGPNGFISSNQNSSVANITTANAGQYLVTATVNGCTSNTGSTNVIISAPSLANAGNNRSVCISNSSVNLNGIVSGGTNTGTWSTNGTGNFSPSRTNLGANYIFSSADKSAGSVQLSLQSTNNGACPASTSSFIISFEQIPFVYAGRDTLICANSTVQLNGSFANAGGGIWNSTGTGRFSPSNTNRNAIYIPGSSDLLKGKVTITFTTTGNGNCKAASGSFQALLNPLPRVNAGPDKFVIENNCLTLTPSVNGQDLKYSWSPGVYLSSNSIPDPLCTPATNMTYTITATDKYGCSASDDISIKVLKLPIIPNVFTPNGDGINETWLVKYLSDFTDCSVEIFNRYGQLVFHSTGYNQPWDGSIKGTQAPAATYYYIINLKNGLKPIAGFVDIVR